MLYKLRGPSTHLRTVGVLAGVGHGQETGLGVLQLEVLVFELGAIDGLSAGAIAVGEVTALNHELLDNTVEGGAFVAKALLASSQGTEVLGGLRSSLAVEADDNTA